MACRGERGLILSHSNTCSVLVAAAGRGTRAGLPYPKTLYPVRGVPILVRILRTLAHLDPFPTVIVSPSGRAAISECLSQNGLSADLVDQAEPKGMGDAVLCFRRSKSYGASENALLIWGDIPFIEKETVDRMVAAHFDHANDFTFVTAHTQKSYTRVRRDTGGNIIEVEESREFGGDVKDGERDIGLFIFRHAFIMELLERDAPGKYGKTTGEHGFLYIIGELASRGYRVEGIPIARDNDLISFNKMEDVVEIPT